MKHLRQIPESGSYILRHQGDVLEIGLDTGRNRRGKAWLRTNIARAAARRAEVVAFAESGSAILGRDWHDIPMRHVTDNRFSLSIPLLEVGCFEAKAFFLPDGSSEPEWPEGKNSHIKVEPADYCCNNTIYAAFVRQFGAALNSKDPAAGHAQSIRELDALGYSVIPRSGTFRDLIKELDFIMGTLRFRIIQLLPIHPTPTTYARMGRFGSPFAAMDFEEVDPALAEFDRRTTPLDQFRELVDAVHQRDGRLFIDIPSNHTGWAAHLQMRHPEWFVHNGDRTFQSPGAWGVTWEDLSQLDYKNLALWKYMAEVLLLWRRRGVDGFRCDAGYMIPYPAWEYIVAKVRNEFPDTVFLLEGLGGKAEVVESLLAGADLNWAYSELFQNYDRAQIESYLPGAMHVSSTRGTLVHFAETHDNLRLAARSHSHARMRTALCALASHNGSFGITNGVEWFADEKIDVHEASHLNWGSADNQIDHVARLNAILEVNPAFQPDSTVRMIQHGPGNVLVLLRESSAPVARVLVVANLNDDKPDTASWKESDWHAATEGMHDLVSGRQVTVERTHEILRCSLAPGEVLCLSTEPACLSAVEQALQHAPSASGRQVTQRFRAKALEVYSVQHGSRDCSNIDLEGAVRELARNPRLFCHSAARNPKTAAADSAGALSHGGLPPVTTWVWPRDARRTVMVPPGHFLNIRCKHRFTAELSNRDTIVRRETSLPQEDGSHFALFVPVAEPERQSEYSLLMTVHEPEVCSRTTAPVIFLTRLTRALVRTAVGPTELRRDDCYALCTNGRGAMAQVRGAWGEIRTQYDALLAGNLHHAYPVDRHVMLTRCRGWIANKGYSLPINIDCLEKFSAGPDGVLEWLFAAPVGQGKIINLQMRFWMNHGRNAVTIEISRKHARADSDDLDDIVPVKLILRPDIEDRSNHCKTKAYAGPEAAWQRAVTAEATGFLFSPSEDRRLRMSCAPGTFTREPEWSYMVAHPVDADRGFDGSSDLFSPGFFSADIAGGQKITVQAEILSGPSLSDTVQVQTALPKRTGPHREESSLEDAMRNAMQHFVVKRDDLSTVIAGYPWFLDWGRDTLICLRGLIAAGMTDESAAIIRQFARFEQGGTLPNMLRGNDSANRETSDAPLWLFVACSDLMRATDSKSILDSNVGGRTILDVLRSIVAAHIKGTSTGVVMDPGTGLVFSPAHFTWMDTNYPAGSPRQGYPIEIQALWYTALETLSRIDGDASISALAGKVRESIRSLFTRGGQDYLCDCLHGTAGVGAADATPDDALRPNQLLAVTLGAVQDRALQEAIVASCEELLVPGAIRTLGDRPVKYALPVRNGGILLNDPHTPYWGRYQGDEDTRRKPAYHNGTAWAWLYPSYSEALVVTYGDAVRNTALSLLSAGSQVASTGCLGLLPEIVDGNTPHSPRGCGAQAWSVTEFYRVLAVLKGK